MRSVYGLLGLSALVMVTAVLGLAIGSVSFSTEQLLSALLYQQDSVAHSIVWELRWPRVRLALLVGAALSLAGWQTQTLLRNPLADPYVLGVSAMASLGALLALWFRLPESMVSVAAAVGAAAGLFSVAILSEGVKIERLLLIGLMVGSTSGALTTLLLSLAAVSQLPGMLFWLFGHISASAWYWPIAVTLVGSLLFSLAHSRALALVAQGDHFAAMLGVPLTGIKLLLWGSASLLTATAVVASGGIGFIGLGVPHLARRFFARSVQAQLLGTVLIGALLLCAADTIARTVWAPHQLPVGVITALVGAPVLILLLRKIGFKEP